MMRNTSGDVASAQAHAQPTPDFKKVGQLRHGASSVIGVMAAFLCAVCVMYLTFVLIMPIHVALWAALTLMISFGALGSPVTYVIVALAGTQVFFGGIVLGRFLLRAFPPRLSAERRKGVPGFIGVLTIWFVFSVCLFVFNRPGPLPTSTPAASPLVSSFLAAQSTADRVLQFEEPVFWWLGFALPLFLRHWNPRRFLNQPFVLFLRRFSGFPDRTVQHAVLRHVPPGKPVAFLTPTGSRAGDWDPFRVGIAGIKLRRPIRSMPIILRSTNEGWKEAAKDLISHAERIVLDLSEGSGAIQAEIAMIDAAARWPDVVVLVKEGTEAAGQPEQLSQFTNKGATAVTYKTSWARAAPRLFFGVFATLLVMEPLFFVLPMVVTTLTGLGVGTSGSLLPTNLFGSRWYWLLNLVTYVAIYTIFFVRPALSKASVTALSKTIGCA